MTSSGHAKPSLTSFLEALRTSGGLRFDYTIATQEADSEVSPPPRIEVTFSGPDAPLLLERNGELLHALESLAAAILRLEPDQAEQVSFDAEGFKAGRDAAMARLAEDAVATVQTSGKPYLFAPMNSRERRMLHLALVSSGLATASSGLGPRRFVVLYPAGHTPEPERFDRPSRPSGPNRKQGNFRQGRPDRNQSGYRSGGQARSAQPRPSRPEASGSPTIPSAAPSIEPQDPDSLGNRGEPNTTSAVDKPATDARLDSIRRAFRKR